MSELAFDKDSEPIEIHPDMESWAVRAFQNPGARGTCAIARDDEGAPIHIERDGGFLDLKRAVRGVPALYRLDQCDGSRARIVGAPAAYVLIADPQRNAGLGAGLDSSSQEPMLLVVVELIRAFGDAHRVLVKEQANMMRSAAEVLRAADQAGISKRPAPPPEPAPAVDDDDDELEDERGDEDDTDDQPPPKHISEVLVEKLIPKLDMMLSHYIAKRMKSDAPPPAATPSPTPAPAPAPAPAAAPSAPPPPAGAAAGPSPSSSPPSAAAPGPSPAASGATATETVTGAPSPEGAPRNATPAITPEQINHLLAIRARLTPREQAIADLVRERMTPAQQEQWLVELSAMTVEQALQVVRSMIPKPASKRPPGVPTSTDRSPPAPAAATETGLALVTQATEEES